MAASRRSNRVRFKPLEYWNNEKLQYGLHGDLQYIKTMLGGSKIELDELLHETAMESSQTNISLMPMKMSSNHEASILKVITLNANTKNDAINTNNTIMMNGEKHNVLQQSKRKHPFHGKTKKINLTDKTISKSPAHLKKQVSHKLQNIGRRNRKQCIIDTNSDTSHAKLYSKKSEQDNYSADDTLHSLVNISSEDNEKLQLNVPESTTKSTGIDGIGNDWKLSDMYMMRNEWDEKYFIKRGPEIPTSTFKYGFIFLVSKTLHWQDSYISKGIFVIEGSGKVSHEFDGKKKQVNLSKGLELNIQKGNTLLEKNEDCDILKLFIIYK